MPRCGSPRSCTSPAGSASTRSWTRCWKDSGAAARGGASPSTPCSPRCGPRPARWRSPSLRSATATRAESDSISPGARPGARRAAPPAREIAELAARPRGGGEGGFDIAGAEAGSPPSRHLDAFQYVARENFHITIHAGEGFGLPSIWEAVQFCGADRLGHGVRIIDDIRPAPGGGPPALGRLASYLRDSRIPLEMCPTSNVQTGAAKSIKDHPIGLLRELLFRVTVNTDNRLMSGVTLSSEFQVLSEAFGYGWGDVEWLTTNAMKSAFAPFDERLKIINLKIKPGFAVVRTAPP